MKISVIIPMFNAEKYLKECVESFLKNDEEDFELIFIDDSSTDHSKKIIEKYLSNKVHLFDNPKKGVSSARNIGLKYAKGDFVTFCDSDDYVSNDYFQIIKNNINENGSLIFGYFEKFVNCKCEKNAKLKNNDIFLSLLDRNCVGGYVWNKVYDLRLIRKNNIYFNNRYHYLEDLDFNYQYFSVCENVQVLPNCLYFYRMRNSSVVNNFSIANCSALDVLINIKNKYILSKDSLNYLKINYLEFFYTFKYLSKKNNIEYKFIKYKFGFSCRRNFKDRIKYLILKYIPHLYFSIINIRRKKKSLFV